VERKVGKEVGKGRGCEGEKWVEKGGKGSERREKERWGRGWCVCVWLEG